MSKTICYSKIFVISKFLSEVQLYSLVLRIVVNVVDIGS